MKMSKQTDLSEDKWILMLFKCKQAELPQRVGQRCDSLARKDQGLRWEVSKDCKVPCFLPLFQWIYSGNFCLLLVFCCHIKSGKQFHSKGISGGSNFSWSWCHSWGGWFLSLFTWMICIDILNVILMVIKPRSLCLVCICKVTDWFLLIDCFSDSLSFVIRSLMHSFSFSCPSLGHSICGCLVLVPMLGTGMICTNFSLKQK